MENLATDENGGTPGTVDGTGGQGGAGTAGSEGEGGEGKFAGYETPEELAAAHTNLIEQKDALDTQVKNLESLKGRHGNEIGTLKGNLAALEEKIAGLEEAAAEKVPEGPNLDDIAKQLENGDISEAQAITMAAEVTTKATETRLGAEFKKLLKEEIGALKNETEREKYIAKFLDDNPGYEQAYADGRLNSWIEQGMSGEEAWLHYQIQAKDSELKTLKESAEQDKIKAKEEGISKGTQLEKGKSPAGKVLGGKGTQFSGEGDGANLADPNVRRDQGVSLLKKLRSS